MRTSSNITIALHMFFRTSGSSSLAKKNRLPIKDLKSFVNQLITKIFNFLKKIFTNEVIDVIHESLRPPNNKLVDASNRMRPDLGAGVFEKLQELWNQEIQRPAQRIRI